MQDEIKSAVTALHKYQELKDLHILSKYFFLIFPEGRIFNDINTQIM